MPDIKQEFVVQKKGYFKIVCRTFSKETDGVFVYRNRSKLKLHPADSGLAWHGNLEKDDVIEAEGENLASCLVYQVPKDGSI